MSCNAAAHGAPWPDAMELWHLARKRRANNQGDILKDDTLVISLLLKSAKEGSEQLGVVPFE